MVASRVGPDIVGGLLQWCVDCAVCCISLLTPVRARRQSWLVYGGKTGWVGGLLMDMLKARGEVAVAAEARLENREAIERYVHRGSVWHKTRPCRGAPWSRPGVLARAFVARQFRFLYHRCDRQ